MDIFYLLVIEMVLHVVTILYCVFAVFRRWGYYWLLPTAAALLFALHRFPALLASASNRSSAPLQGRDLLTALIPLFAALLWLLAIISVHTTFIACRKARYNRKVFIDNINPTVTLPEGEPQQGDTDE